MLYFDQLNAVATHLQQIKHGNTDHRINPSESSQKSSPIIKDKRTTKNGSALGSARRRLFQRVDQPEQVDPATTSFNLPFSVLRPPSQLLASLSGLSSASTLDDRCKERRGKTSTQQDLCAIRTFVTSLRGAVNKNIPINVCS